MKALLQSDIPNIPCYRGKVRDVYDLGDRLVLVATDRISAFDWILPNAIPDKGRLLTAITLFWLDFLKVPNHLISTDLKDMGPEFTRRPELAGRSTLVRKTRVVPIECVVRGYLAGSGWKEYQQSGTVCGIPLSKGLGIASALDEPIFTPATKESSGHDINISFGEMVDRIGEELAVTLRQKSIDIYNRASTYAKTRGIVLADTKFEWGLTPQGEIILIDEVLTPDSSRFWPADKVIEGKNPPSYDKQFVRDWLETTTWDKNSPPPNLPGDVIERTRKKYIEAYEHLTGLPFKEQDE